MKINKPSNKRSIIIASSIIGVLLLGGGVFALWQLNNSEPSNQELTEGTDNTSAVKEEQVQENEVNATGEPDAGLPSKSSENNQPVSNETNSGSSNITPEKPQISRAGQSGDSIRVVAIFQQESSGYCELKLSQASSQTVSREANITVGPTYYVCSFDIARNQLLNSGQWQAVVVHHIGNNTTKSDEVMFEVN